MDTQVTRAELDAEIDKRDHLQLTLAHNYQIAMIDLIRERAVLLKALQAAVNVSDQYHQHAAGVQDFWNCHEELKSVLDEIPDDLKNAAREMWAVED